MIEFLPLLLFFVICLSLLMGFPVAFTLGGVSILFALFISIFGLFDLTLLETIPNRLYGIMTNVIKLFMILKNINQICQSILIFFPTLLGKVSTWFLVLMIFLTAYVVIARYVFGVGILSLQELIIYSHGITFLICAAYAMREDQHVRVDILYRRFSERRKKLINLIGNVIFLQPMLWVILFVSFEYVSFSWEIKEISAEPGGLPFVYLYKTVIVISTILLLLQSFANILSFFIND